MQEMQQAIYSSVEGRITTATKIQQLVAMGQQHTRDNAEKLHNQKGNLQ
jgi:hypothetical protein